MLEALDRRDPAAQDTDVCLGDPELLPLVVTAYGALAAWLIGVFDNRSANDHGFLLAWYLFTFRSAPTANEVCLLCFFAPRVQDLAVPCYGAQVAQV
jgi:hypothetical protein